MPKFLNHVDLNLNELRQAKLFIQPSDPASLTTKEALVWYDSATKTIKYSDGTSTAKELGTSTLTLASGKIYIGDGSNVATAQAVTGDVTIGATGITAIGANKVTTGMLAAGVRLDTINAPTGSVSLNTQKITNLLDPTSAQDAATKFYVDATAQGLDTKASVFAATTGSETTITISSGHVTQISGTTLDGQSPAVNDRILIKDAPASTGAGSAGSNQPANGIYTVTSNTTNLSVSRATDMDVWSEVPGSYVWVEQGTTNLDSGWVCTTDVGTGVINTDNIKWVLFASAAGFIAGNGLTKTGNTIDVVGTSNRISVAADAIDISSAYVGQATITTLGTIASGTWGGSATTIAIGSGGTGQTSAANARKSSGGLGVVETVAFNSLTKTAGTAGTYTHSLNTKDVHVLVKGLNADTDKVVYPDIDINNVNSIDVTFAAATTASDHRIIVQGVNNT